MTELTTSRNPDQKPQVIVHGGSSDSVYGLGFIGALVYFLGRANNFQEGVIGFLKAIVWPAILVYEILKLLKVGQAEESPSSHELEI